jgi:hypothetical protein
MSLYLTKYYGTKTYGGVDAYVHVLFSPPLAVDGQIHVPVVLSLRKETRVPTG